MLKATLATAAFVAVSGSITDAFERFKVAHGVKYASQQEHNDRLLIFAKNIQKINQMNEEHVELTGEAVFGITRFSDLTEDEMKSRYLTSRVPEVEDGEREAVVLAGPVANDVDWRGKGVLTPVKDQGQCGSCWAFSATEAIESYAQMSGKYSLLELAPQQIVSCDSADSGCNGGWPYKAYGYVQTAGGIEGESAYPYTSGTSGSTGTCHADSSKFQVKVAGYKSVIKGESNLAAALNNGPVSVCVDAANWSSYRSGILTTCGSSVDHCVQAVGYTADAWIVRNSWGSSWGESGFIRIARGSDLCLIGDYVTYPLF